MGPVDDSVTTNTKHQSTKALQKLLFTQPHTQNSDCVTKRSSCRQPLALNIELSIFLPLNINYDVLKKKDH